MNKQRLEQALNDGHLEMRRYVYAGDPCAYRTWTAPPGAELGDVVALARALINVGFAEKVTFTTYVTGETLAVFDLAPEGGAQQVYPTATPLLCNSQSPCASDVD